MQHACTCVRHGRQRRCNRFNDLSRSAPLVFRGRSRFAVVEATTTSTNRCGLYYTSCIRPSEHTHVCCIAVGACACVFYNNDRRELQASDARARKIVCNREAAGALAVSFVQLLQRHICSCVCKNYALLLVSRRKYHYASNCCTCTLRLPKRAFS